MKIKFNSIDDVSRFVRICELYDFSVDAKVNHYIVDAKSFLGIIALGLDNAFEIIPHAPNLAKNMEMLNAIKMFTIT